MLKKAITTFLNKFLKPKVPNHVPNEMNKTNLNSQGASINTPQTNIISPKSIYTDKEIWTIGGNVQIIRERKGLTQLQLAEHLGYKSASFVSRLELWETEKLTHDQVLKLAECLNVSVDKLLQKSK